jgi:DNA primase
MGNWIDFRELRSKLNFKDVLEKYQVRLHFRSGGRQAVGPCPLPEHGTNRTKESFSANLEKGIFQCFSCEAKGNVLDFACLMENLNPARGEDLRKVALSLAKEFGIASRRPETPGPDTKSKTKTDPTLKEFIVNAPLDFELKDLDPNHDYLRKRGFTPETIDLFGLGYCARGRMAGRIAIPLHNFEGNLVGYAGRLVEKSPEPSVSKYLFPGTRTHKGVTYEFKKSFLLYNANRVPIGRDDLILTEGFASVWWLTQNGFPNCVAVMGSTISEEQADLACTLVVKGGRVTIFPDRDDAGNKFAQQATQLFSNKAKTRCVTSNDGVQPTDLVTEELSYTLGTSNEVPAGIGGGVSSREDVCKILNEFPCLQHLKITPENWDSEAFERQAAKFSSGELSAAQFILGIWNPTTTWKCGKFDLIEAAARLDHEHRQVIIDWFSEPWWP